MKKEVVKMETKKFLIMGADRSVTTTVMENICEKLFQRGILEFGSLRLNSRKICLFNYLKHEELNLMPSSFFKKIDGAVIVIDNKNGIKKTDRELITIIDNKTIPYVLLAYNWDPGYKHEKIDLINIPLIPTVAIDRKSILKALEILLELISPYLEFVKNHPYVEVVKIKNSCHN